MRQKCRFFVNAEFGSGAFAPRVESGEWKVELRTLRESGVWRVESGVADAEGGSNLRVANYHIAERLSYDRRESFQCVMRNFVPMRNAESRGATPQHPKKSIRFFGEPQRGFPRRKWNVESGKWSCGRRRREQYKRSELSYRGAIIIRPKGVFSMRNA